LAVTVPHNEIPSTILLFTKGAINIDPDNQEVAAISYLSYHLAIAGLAAS
jgi:hypothetical protein